MLAVETARSTTPDPSPPLQAQTLRSDFLGQRNPEALLRRKEVYPSRGRRHSGESYASRLGRTRALPAVPTMFPRRKFQATAARVLSEKGKDVLFYYWVIDVKRCHHDASLELI
jgi:hypothetical protein